MPEKIRVISVFGPVRDNRVIIGTNFTGFESAYIALLAADVLTQFYLKSTFTRRINITRAAESCL